MGWFGPQSGDCSCCEETPPTDPCICPAPTSPGPFIGATSVVACVSVDFGICTGTCSYQWSGTVWVLLSNSCAEG